MPTPWPQPRPLITTSELARAASGTVSEKRTTAIALARSARLGRPNEHLPGVLEHTTVAKGCGISGMDFGRKRAEHEGSSPVRRAEGWFRCRGSGNAQAT